MYINNKKIDTEPILHLIEKGKTIAAIKYVRSNTNIGLKESKNIVDNLSINKSFYDNERLFFTEHNSNIKKRNKRRKGNHIIKKSKSKTYFFIVILLIIILLFYYFKN